MRRSQCSRLPFAIPVSGERVIRGDVRFTGTRTGQPVILICHSFMAFKEWGFFPHVAEEIASSGFVTVLFNFSLNGAVGDDARITRFDLFEQNTISAEVEDLGSVIDAVVAGTVDTGPGETSRIGLLGHSRGGGIAIVKTSEDPRIRSLVTWAAIARFDRWNLRQKSRWRTEGFLALAKDSSVSPLRLGSGFLEDVERNGERLDLRKAARRIGSPWLIIHGDADLTVPPREAEELFTAASPVSTRLELLEHTGHLFNAGSPDDDQYATIDRVIGRTAEWFHSSIG